MIDPVILFIGASTLVLTGYITTSKTIIAAGLVLFWLAISVI